MKDKLYFEGYIESNKVQRGEYSVTAIYYRGDVVQDGGGYYVSLTDSHSGHPLSNEMYWTLYSPTAAYEGIINDEHLESTTTTLSAYKIRQLIQQSLLADEVGNPHMTSVAPTAIGLAWSPASKALSYDVAVNGVFLTNTSDTVCSLTDLQPNTEYAVTVKSRNDFGTSAGSSLTVKTAALPSAVVQFQASETEQTSVKLEWTPAQHATHYRLYQDGILLATGVSGISYLAQNLQPNTEYRFSIVALNEYGSSPETVLDLTTLPIAAPSNLIFHLALNNMAGTTNSTVYDTVQQIPCTLVNVSHSGSDGWLDQRGLTLETNDYISVPLHTPAFQELVKFNEQGATFEFAAYDVNGILFRNESSTLRAYVRGNSASSTYQYIAADQTKKAFGDLFFWFVNPGGNRNIIDTLNPLNELNVVTVRFHPNGEADMLINGRPSAIKLKAADFASYANLLSAGPLFIRRNQIALNTTPATIQSFSIYNRVLTNEEVLSKYEALKQNEPLYSVSVLPGEVALNTGESRLITVVASPSHYTPLLENSFETGNDGYVTVSPSGLLTGIHNGETEVAVKSIVNGQIHQKFVRVKVGANTTPPPASTRVISGISLNWTVPTLEVGESFSALATTLPFDVYNDNIVVWESSNPEVCTVNFGVLKGIAAGQSTITAYDYSKTYSKSFVVTVVAAAGITIAPSEVYEVPIQNYGIHNDGTHAMSTTNGIQAAMDYAHLNGYKKVVFPLGEYLVTPEARTLLLPTYMVIDFSGATVRIAPNSLSPTGYVMIRFANVSHTKIVNMHLYGENESVAQVGDAHETCISVTFDQAYKSGLENCTISKSPGFNITANNFRGTDQPGRHPSRTNWQAGQIDPVTGFNDDSVLTATFRNINYLNVSALGDNYTLGYTQGYFNYPHLRSRLYSIYWYDQDYYFIEAHMHRMQFYVYDKPAGAYYAKIVIYQENLPSSQDNDFNAVAMLRSFLMPVDCFIRNCTIEDNNSCGFAMTGGRGWVIENNTFSRNGKRMPACDIDWEDGWELSIGDICRGNTFNSPSGIIFSGCNSTALFDNTFNRSNLLVYERAANFRIYNNFFDGKGHNRNITLSTCADSYFSNNILKQVAYTKGIHHPGASYQVRDTGNTSL
ncbi:fibronectin type III domain-containing protein [Paenibacillus sp. GCM10027627]|uniref:fibronectin type III domain-containing protein n=1 Tax=unclassified Paenibacillus TaxID=185978 RepID=UPI00364229B6